MDVVYSQAPGSGGEDRAMNWNNVISEMQNPHWLMAAGGVLLAVGLIGFVFKKTLSRQKSSQSRRPGSDHIQSFYRPEDCRPRGHSNWALAIRPPLRELGHTSSERIGLTLSCRHHGNLPRLGARRKWRTPFCEALGRVVARGVQFF